MILIISTWFCDSKFSISCQNAVRICSALFNQAFEAAKRVLLSSHLCYSSVWLVATLHYSTEYTSSILRREAKLICQRPAIVVASFLASRVELRETFIA